MCKILTIAHMCGHHITILISPPCAIFQAYVPSQFTPRHCPFKTEIKGGDGELCVFCDTQLGREWLEREYPLINLPKGCGWGIWEKNWAGWGNTYDRED